MYPEFCRVPLYLFSLISSPGPCLSHVQGHAEKNKMKRDCTAITPQKITRRRHKSSHTALQKSQMSQPFLKDTVPMEPSHKEPNQSRGNIFTRFRVCTSMGIFTTHKYGHRRANCSHNTQREASPRMSQ